MNINKCHNKGQAMVEYALVVGLTALAFASSTNFFNKSVLSFFNMLGNFLRQKGP